VPSPLDQLSARERELLALVAQGHTDAQIADHLYISVSTVRSHLDRIRDKTGYRRRTELTRLALSAGLV
jgi:DNA-binding CsgD family transcriptional regulator